MPDSLRRSFRAAAAGESERFRTGPWKMFTRVHKQKHLRLRQVNQPQVDLFEIFADKWISLIQLETMKSQ